VGFLVGCLTSNSLKKTTKGKLTKDPKKFKFESCVMGDYLAQFKEHLFSLLSEQRWPHWPLCKNETKNDFQAPSAFNIVCRPTSHYHFQFVAMLFFY
jgi:hypothetical protein